MSNQTPDTESLSIVEIDYTNWRGNRRWRPIQPVRMVWGSHAPYITEVQWMLVALDLDANCHAPGQPQFFALKNVHGWRPKDEPTV